MGKLIQKFARLHVRLALNVPHAQMALLGRGHQDRFVPRPVHDGSPGDRHLVQRRFDAALRSHRPVPSQKCR